MEGIEKPDMSVSLFLYFGKFLANELLQAREPLIIRRVRIAEPVEGWVSG